MSGPRNQLEAYQPINGKKPFIEAYKNGGLDSMLAEIWKQLEALTDEAKARDKMFLAFLRDLPWKKPTRAERESRKLLLEKQKSLPPETIDIVTSEKPPIARKTDVALWEARNAFAAINNIHGRLWDMASTLEEAKEEGEKLMRFFFEVGFHLGQLGEYIKNPPKGRPPVSPIHELALAAWKSLSASGKNTGAKEILRKIEQQKPKGVDFPKRGGIRWKNRSGKKHPMSLRSFQNNVSKWQIEWHANSPLRPKP
jgi:hypothetical protein